MSNRADAQDVRTAARPPPRHLVHAIAGAVVGAHLAAAAGESQPFDPDEELPLVSAALADGPVTVTSRLRFTVEALIAGFATFLVSQPR